MNMVYLDLVVEYSTKYFLMSTRDRKDNLC